MLLQIFHAFRAKWMVVLRRAVETMAITAILFLVLFIPIAVGMKHLYAWVEPPANLSHEALELLHHKAPYLNTTFFLIRTVFYFAVAGVISQRLFGLSTKQDSTGDIALTARARRFGTGALPFIALSFSFAAFDWLMSLDPLWFSTIYGVYFFGGSFLSCISLLVIITDRARGKNLYGDLVSVEHIHNLGKLMLAFTAFWGYIGFSQLLLIWIAGLPEEIPYYITRIKGEWARHRRVPHPGALLLPVLRAALPGAEAQPGSAGPGGDLDPVGPRGGHVLVGHADPQPRRTDVPLDDDHLVRGNRRPGHRLRHVANSRSLHRARA